MNTERYMEKIKTAISYAAEEREVTAYNWNETLKERNVVAFGTGKFFEDTHERLFGMVDIKAVCDNAPEKWGQQFYGKKCISPNELKCIENVFVIIVLGSCMAVAEQMRDLGIPYIHISEMHFSNYEKGKSCMWLNKSLEDIQSVLEYLKDDTSREVFTNVFCNKIYLSKTKTPYDTFAQSGEYFENGCWELGENEYFVDGGAYIGDTLEDFIEKTRGKFEGAYCFEYEACNYKKLCDNISKYREARKRIETYQCGIWDRKEEGICEFRGESDGTQIVLGENCSESAQHCNLDKLDNVLAGKTVSILKLDIEGAEIQGLSGAAGIIRQQKPKLAICLYHRPEDMWEIPMLIKKLNPDYEMIIRHHSRQNYTDTVLYAV